jgi:hypothetical protein
VPTALIGGGIGVGLLTWLLVVRNMMLEALIAIVLLGVIVGLLRYMPVNATVVTLMVYFGVLIDMAIVQDNYLAERIRDIELLILIGLAFGSLFHYRRMPPLILLIPLGGILVVDLISFLMINYPMKVLLGGLSGYLRHSILAYYVYASGFDEKHLKQVLSAVGVLVVLISVFSILQWSTGSFFDIFRGEYERAFRAGTYRAIGVFPWPNELALFAGSWFFVYYFQQERQYKAMAVLLALNLLLSITRMSILIWASLLAVHLWGKRSKRIGVVITLAALLLVGWTHFNEYASDYQVYMSGEAPRVYYLKQALAVLGEYPVFGVGLSRFGTRWSAAVEGEPQYGFLDRADMSTTDIFLANIIAEFGILGTVFLLAFLVIVLLKAAKAGNSYLYSMLFIILSVTNSAHPFFAPHTVIFWILVGMLAQETVRERAVCRVGLDGSKVL